MPRNAKLLAWVTIALAGGVVSALAYLYLANSPVDMPQPVSKSLRFTYTLTNTTSEFIEDAAFISDIPASIPGAQRLESIESSHEYELLGSNGVHKSIRFDVQDLPPYGSRVITVTFRLASSPAPQHSRIDRKMYLKQEKYIEHGTEPVASLANAFAEEEDFPRAAYQWIVNHMQDAGYVAESKGARFAIEQQLGDCTEYMYAFIALARAHGIPARGVAGFVVEGDAEIATSSSYHNWAEFYDGEKWILVDPQRRVFDQDYQNYIAYRIIGGDLQEQISTSRFLAVDERVSIKI